MINFISRFTKTSVFKYGFASIFPRGIAIIFTLILTPLIISKLGAPNYAVWFLATVIPTVISFPDFGISNGIINKIIEVRRENGNISSLSEKLSEVIVILIGFSLLWLILGFIAISVYSSNYSSGASETNIFKALIIALGIFIFSIPASLWPKVQLALEIGHKGVVLEGVGKLLSLILSAAVIFLMPNVNFLIVATLLPATIFGYINMLVFLKSMKQELKIKILGLSIIGSFRNNFDVMRGGSYFTIIQIAFLLAFALDPFIVGYISGSRDVAYFSVIKRPFDALPLIITLFSTALWPVFNRLLADGLIIRARSVIFYLFCWSFLLSMLLSSIIYIFRSNTYGFLGNNSLEINGSDIFWIAIKGVCIILVIILSNYMNATGLLKEQAIIQGTCGVISIFGTILTIKYGGIHEYFMANSLLYAVFAFIPTVYICMKDIQTRVKIYKGSDSMGIGGI